MEDWQRRMVELQTKFVENNKELQEKQGQLTGPIIKKLGGIIARLAKKSGYELIIDKQAVPYARPDLDLTEQIVQMYNAGDAGTRRPRARRKTRRNSSQGAMIGLAFPSPVTLAQLAARFGGIVDAGAEQRIAVHVAPVDAASAVDDLAPLLARRYLKVARQSSALLLVDASLARLVPEGRRWVHPHAGFAFAQLLAELAPPPPVDERALARIEPGADVHATAVIAPGVVIRAGAVIGPASRVEPNAVIYGKSRLGRAWSSAPAR